MRPHCEAPDVTFPLALAVFLTEKCVGKEEAFCEGKMNNQVFFTQKKNKFFSIWYEKKAQIAEQGTHFGAGGEVLFWLRKATKSDLFSHRS